MKRKWVLRGVAWILLAVLLMTGSPVVAWDVGEGMKCGSLYGEVYVGSDGKVYYSEDTEKYLLYNKDGTTTRHTMEGGYARQWFYMINEEGVLRKVFCIEAGVDFHESDSGYTADSGLDSQYCRRLPESARKGIALTLLYGWQPGRRLPVSGINEDDYAVATQILLWEYQQQLRVDTGKRRSNGWTSADQFYSNLEGRPAEKAYDWILKQIEQHMEPPTFAAASVPESELYIMKYDADSGIYSITLEDTNKTLADLKWESRNDIKITRRGNQYTFSSEVPLTSAATLKIQKVTESAEDEIFIWGQPGYQTMVSGACDAQYFYMRLMTEGDGSLKLVKTSEDQKVSGIRFLIDGDGKQITAATSKEGVIEVSNLRPGEYMITELDTGDYVPQESQKVMVKSGEVTEVSFDNQMKKGSLQVMKTAEDGMTEGIQFRLYGTSKYGTAVEATAITNNDGIAIWSDIPISGEDPYILEEVNTGVQYVVPESQKVVITWNQQTDISIHNAVKRFQLQVKKNDSMMQGAQGDGTLAGAQYGMYLDGELVDTYTTDENGCFTTMVYPCGEGWTLKELVPSEGYIVNPTEYEIGAEPELYELELNSIYKEVSEEVICGQLQIVKHVETAEEGTAGVMEKAEADAVFEVYLKSAGSYEMAAEWERALLTTDENGYARSQELPYGSYVVHQIAGKEGFMFVPDWTVNITEDGKLYSYILNNRMLKSNIRIEKQDAETGKTIALAGTGFQILDANSNLVSQTLQYPTPTEIDTFYTNEEGWLMLPEALPYGNYTLLEVQAPQGYLLDGETIAFTVDGSREEIVLVKSNIAQKGRIRIEKYGEVFASVVENGEIYQPVFGVQKLAGAEFTITAAEDIYTADGTLRAAKDAVVAVVTTDEEGIAETEALYLGKYTVTETKVPDGYFAGEPIDAVLAAEDSETEVTVQCITPLNHLQKAKLHLNKEMEVNEKFGRGTMGEILSVKFGLYADEDIVAADGSVIPKGQLIEIAGCDEEGLVEFQTELPYGKYVVKERTTHAAYKLDETPRPVTYTFRSDWPLDVFIDVDPDGPILNEYERGQIAGKKMDDTGNMVEGAVIGLFDMEETDFCEETALSLATSGINGAFQFKDVPFGSYILKEIKAPEGYVLNDLQQIVEVEDEYIYVEVEIVNKYITGKLILSKTDVSTGELIPNCGIEIQDAEGNVLLQDVTNAEGIVEFELGYGNYFYREYDAPDGYLIDENEYPFSILEDGQIIKAEMTNRMIEGLLVIKKLDGETGDPLAKCGIEILDASGTILQRQYTDDAGMVMFGLLYGEYYYREFDAPEGYELDETARAFRIEEDECVLTREMENFKEKEVPQTGDSMQSLIPWLVGSAASVILLLVLAKWRQHRS